MSGRLIGIARHDRPKGAMEVLDHGTIAPGEGLRGDFRGALKSGSNQREVTVMSREAWDAALIEVAPYSLAWQERRVNLLVEGITLPREAGATIRVARDVVVEVTGETEPCERMEALVPGLRAALTPDWRGGVTTRVISGGEIRIGDEVERGS